MEIYEGQIWKIPPLKLGDGRYAVYIDRDLWEYLQVKDEERENVVLVLKADKGKWGRFCGFGINREKPVKKE